MHRSAILNEQRVEAHAPETTFRIGRMTMWFYTLAQRLSKNTNRVLSMDYVKSKTDQGNRFATPLRPARSSLARRMPRACICKSVTADNKDQFLQITGLKRGSSHFNADSSSERD
jgi:hypothetical protein